MALCSLTISFHRHPGDIEDDNPKWVRILHEKYNIHPEWLHALAHSSIADFSPMKRVGAFVNMNGCQWFSWFPYMVHANVPLYLYYGDANLIRCCDHPQAQLYRPTSAEIQEELCRKSSQSLMMAWSADLCAWCQLPESIDRIVWNCTCT